MAGHRDDVAASPAEGTTTLIRRGAVPRYPATSAAKGSAYADQLGRGGWPQQRPVAHGDADRRRCFASAASVTCFRGTDAIRLPAGARAGPELVQAPWTASSSDRCSPTECRTPRGSTSVGVMQRPTVSSGYRSRMSQRRSGYRRGRARAVARPGQGRVSRWAAAGSTT